MSRTAIISVDGHVKASRAGYREYLEPKYLDEYDASVKAAEEAGLPDAGNLNPEYGFEAQWDSDRRLEAVEVSASNCERRKAGRVSRPALSDP